MTTTPVPVLPTILRAVCPGCSLLDELVLIISADDDWRAWVFYAPDPRIWQLLIDLDGLITLEHHMERLRRAALQRGFTIPVTQQVSFALTPAHLSAREWAERNAPPDHSS